MELLNAISTMLDERFEKNNEILRQETKEMIAENNKVLLNQFTAVIEEKSHQGNPPNCGGAYRPVRKSLITVLPYLN